MAFASISPTALLAVYCALIFLASLSGGWLLLALRLTHARLQTALSFVSGLMLGIALLLFIPHAADQNGSVDLSMTYVLAGFLTMFFLQRFLPHHHHHDIEEVAHEHSDQDPEHQHEHEHGQGSPEHEWGEWAGSNQLSWAATTVGMAFHSLLDGVALAASVAVAGEKLGTTVGLGTAMAVMLHKPFDSMTVSTLMTVSGCSRRSRHFLNVLFALTTPAGALLFFAGASQFSGTNASFVGSALAFCAGIFLCIACADLLPELQFHSHDRMKLSGALMAGLLIAFLISRIEEGAHTEHPGHSGISAPTPGCSLACERLAATASRL
jgi:zinc and cadmium transporter